MKRLLSDKFSFLKGCFQKRIYVLFIPLIVLGQNCGKSFEAFDFGSDFSSHSQFYAPNCLALDTFDGCIYLKNPWIQGAQFRPNPNLKPEMQSFGIQLPENLKQGVDQNNSEIKIESPLLQDFDGVWKTAATSSEKGLEKVSFLMAYYWSDQVRQFLSLAASSDSPFQEGLKIKTDAKVTGWSAETRTIYLQTREGDKRQVLDASLLVHLMGEAAIASLSQKKVYQISQAGEMKFSACGKNGNPIYQRDCCKTQVGCSTAVTTGLSDVLVALMFPQWPAVGDGVAGQPNGLSNCGISRDPRLNVALTAEQAFNACQASSGAGSIFTLGSLFSSIWWNVRTQVVTQKILTAQEFKDFYLSLLPEIDGDDDFKTVLSKIKTLDDSQFNSRIYKFFSDEYGKRGLL